MKDNFFRDVTVVCVLIFGCFTKVAIDQNKKIFCTNIIVAEIDMYVAELNNASRCRTISGNGEACSQAYTVIIDQKFAEFDRPYTQAGCYEFFKREKNYELFRL